MHCNALKTFTLHESGTLKIVVILLKPIRWESFFLKQEMENVTELTVVLLQFTKA